MQTVDWFRPPRVVLTLFIGMMLVCALTLGWLGRQVLLQDRAVEAQRRLEQLENAAERALAAIERTLATPETEVIIGAKGEVNISPSGRLAYAPVQTTASPVPPGVFAEAEAWEFTRQDPARASDAYRKLAESDNVPVRAAALLSQGRISRRQRKWSEALTAYASLEKLEAATVAGMPASLVARAARCSTLNDSGDHAGARREALKVWNDLAWGKWILNKATLETYLKELRLLAPDANLPPDWEERMALSEAVDRAFAQSASDGRAGLAIGGLTVCVSWEKQRGAWKARLIGPSTWQALWSKLERDTGTSLRVVDSEGRVVHASGPVQSPSAIRSAATTGLPWNLTASALPDVTSSGDWTARRRLLIAGLLVFALVMTLGSFLIARAISREFAVARLQSDFVSAVSHEFRTPLTSIHQLMEMLSAGRITGDGDRQRAYELMLGQSDRLRRLVESLLDLGRMQAREYKFRSDTLDAAEWSRTVAQEFQESVRSRGYTIEFIRQVAGDCRMAEQAAAQNTSILGDREALGGALWNLLDNAVKYSPDNKQVQVAVSSRNGKVEVSVRDHGSGIAKEELKRVFGKFYRGSNAKKQGTKGTGIGLAMVKEIVEAHGGTVRVCSDAGRGSEFTMVLPCRES